MFSEHHESVWQDKANFAPRANSRLAPCKYDIILYANLAPPAVNSVQNGACLAPPAQSPALNGAGPAGSSPPRLDPPDQTIAALPVPTCTHGARCL